MTAGSTCQTAPSPLLDLLAGRARGGLKRIALSRNQLLFARGDVVRAMYFVVSGEVRLVRGSRGGDQAVLQRSRGGFIAEASHGQKSYHCDAVAMLKSLLVAIPRASFEVALRDAGFQKLWQAHICHELRRSRMQCERLMLRTARERIVHFIETEGVDGAVHLEISRKEWACEIGLTHEALYRSLASMRRAGEIVVDGRTLRRGRQ